MTSQTMSSPAATGTWGALINILIEPRKTFTLLAPRRKSFWLPLLVSVLAGELFWLWYYSSIDFDWLRNVMIDIGGPDLNAQQRAAMAHVLTWKVQLGSALVGVVVTTFVISLLQACYLLIVSKVQGGDEAGFLDWFNVASWASVPRILGIVMSAVTFAMSSTRQIAPQSLDPASLNALVLHLPPTANWASIADSIDLPLLWSIGLLGVGYATRRRVSVSKGLVIAAIPYVLIYGIWALIKLKSGG